MGFNLDPTATQLSYFASLVQSDEQFPLLEAAASLAQDEYPELDIQQVLADVDQILARLKRRLAPDASGLHRLKILNRLFFEELGFQGNLNHYHDPENSFLNAVLKTRRGIPISLSVIWLELAQSIGLQAQGVNFPGHFLVKVNLTYPNEGLVVLDVFSGRSLTREALLERLYEFPDIAQTLNAMQIDTSASARALEDTRSRSMDWDQRLQHYLQSATERQIVERMLHNLLNIYRSHNDNVREKQINERLKILLQKD
jgi:regulator of sirC expression with transglutaminase-like and TPR domain